MEEKENNVKALLDEKKYVEAIEIMEKEIRNYKADGIKDRSYFTLLNNFTRACLAHFDASKDEEYFGRFQKVYLEMMDSQPLARSTKFDISRYRKSYYKRYHRKDLTEK